MPQTVDLTKVSLDAKSFVMMSVAFSLVLVAFAVGQYGSRKLKDVIAGAGKGLADEVDDF